MSEHATTSEHGTTVHARKRPAASAPPEQTYGSLLEGNRQAFERWFRGMLELSQEMMQFTQARLQEDAAAWTRLASLRSPEEVLQFQQSFAERISKEYVEEFNRLSTIVAGMTNGIAAPARRPEP